MRLKRLTLHGFKSFADRTEFTFDRGLTGIIGPNGCGKSNVVDAVKWVLGDQRPTSLRGREMADVIFNGAESRAPMGCSEVVLVLERSEGEGNGDGRRELSIGRRLFRSGESDYHLDGRVVRLKDVRDALMDTGLGVGAYSVMEQGKIDAVLSANPEERRKIFDEAAGISRYKLRRKEALRRLDRTELNLHRVSDLRQEKASRLRSLKIQAGKARNYRETADRLMALRVALAFLKSRDMERTLGDLDREVQEAEKAVQAAEKSRDETREKLFSGEEELRDLSETRNRWKDLSAGLRGEERSRQQSLQNGAERLLRNREQARRAERERERIAREKDGLESEIEEIEKRMAALEEQKEEFDAELPRLEEAAGEVRQRWRLMAREREVLQARLLETMHERTRARNLVRDEEIEAQSLRRRSERLERRCAELEEKIAESRAGSLGDWRILEDMVERRERVQRRLEQEAGAADRLSGELGRIQEERGGLERRASALSSRRTLLEELEASHQGLDEAARELLEEGKEVLGRLVDFLDCPPGIGAALEAVLGERVQALLVEDFEKAGRILEALAHRKGGGQVVLLQAPFGGEPGPPPPPRLAELDGRGRPLLDFLVLADPLRAPLEALLGGVLLVPDLETARSLHEGRICVTPRGEVQDGPWIRGGRAEPAAGPIQRRSALEALKRELSAVEGRLADSRQREEEIRLRLERKGGQQRRLESLLEALSRKHHSVELMLQARGDREAELSEQGRQAEEEREEILEEKKDSLSRLMKPLLNSFLLERKEARLEEEQRELSAKVQACDLHAQKEQERLSALSARKAGVEGELGGVRQGRDLRIRNLQDMKRRLAELHREIGGCERERAELSASMAVWRSQILDFACRARFVEDRVADLAEGVQTFEQAAEERKRRAGQREEALEEARQHRSELILKKRELGFELDHLDKEIREDYRIELPRLRGEIEGYGLWADGPLLGPMPEGRVRLRLIETSLHGPPAPPDFYRREQGLERLWERPDFLVAEAESECGILGARLQRLGAVNLGAEKELSEVQAEVELLERDCRDLEEARKELFETLRRINAESRILFDKTFEASRRNFQEIFRMLFQGGKADMELVDPEDPLESGIEIFARPPGKQLTNIRLLSGGERSLTALAILFAVFKVKPSPFCILDEVDAALDDPNVERFLRVLADFVRETQFLVVTHHKRTMLDCQVLYGVTMPRKGISSRMSVELSEVGSGAVDRFLDRPEAAPEKREPANAP